MSQTSSPPSQARPRSNEAPEVFYRRNRQPAQTESNGGRDGIEFSQVPPDPSKAQDQPDRAFPGYFRPRARPRGAEVPSRVIDRPMPEDHRLGTLSTAALIINKMIGTGIFSKPSEILKLTGSKGGALFLWVTGGVMTLAG